MTDLLGIIDLDRPGQAAAGLPRLVLTAGETQSTFQSRHIAVAAQSSPRGQSIHLVDADGVMLALCGSMALDEHLPAQQRYPDRYSHSLAHRLLELYCHSGITALQGLNGQYVIAVYDETTHSLHIINDRLGVQPFYYWHSGSRLIFSSSSREISRAPQFTSPVSAQALFDLLATGQMLAERTLFEDVHALPPAAHLNFSSTGLRIQRYWQPTFLQPGERPIPGRELAEGLCRHFETAVERHTESKSCLLLTGGLDSRWLGGALVDCYGSHGLVASTIGHERAADTLLARQVAASLGIQHQVVEIDPAYLEAFARESVLRSDGGMNIEASWILSLTAGLRASSRLPVITGIGAEIISGRYYLAEHPFSDTQTALAHFANGRWKTDQAALLIRADLRRQVKAANMEQLRSLAAQPGSNHAGQAYDSIFLSLLRRHPSGNLLQADADVREPYLDRDLVDFALRIPASERSRVFKLAIQHSYPALAQIKTNERFVSLEDDLRKRSSYQYQLSRLANRISHRLLPVFRRNAPAGDAPWSTIYPNHWMRTSARGFTRSVLDKIHLLDCWIDIDAARRLVEAHFSGRQHSARMIAGLMTAIIWMEEIYR